jgi:hypothetical protein
VSAAAVTCVVTVGKTSASDRAGTLFETLPTAKPPDWLVIVTENVVLVLTTIVPRALPSAETNRE